MRTKSVEQEDSINEEVFLADDRDCEWQLMRSVAIGGFFDEMVIMGGTGCYSRLQGTVKGSSTVTGFLYRVSIF